MGKDDRGRRTGDGLILGLRSTVFGLFSFQIDKSRPHAQTPDLDLRIGLPQGGHHPFGVQRPDADALAQPKSFE